MFTATKQTAESVAQDAVDQTGIISISMDCFFYSIFRERVFRLNIGESLGEFTQG